jgi:hypothetical protein
MNNHIVSLSCLPAAQNCNRIDCFTIIATCIAKMQPVAIKIKLFLKFVKRQVRFFENFFSEVGKTDITNHHQGG